MKIKTSKITKKTIIVAAVSLAVILLSYTAAAAVYKLYPFNVSSNTEATTTQQEADNINYDEPTEAQKQAGEAQKKLTAEQQQDDEVSSNPPEVTITALNQTADMVQIRTLISAITDQGKCTLTLTKDSTVVVKSVGIQALPSESTCKGFDVAVSELASGSWNASVVVEVGSLSGSAVKEFTIE